MLISLWCIMSAHQGVKGHGYIGGFCGTGKLVQSRAVFHETSKNPRNEQKSKTSKNFSPFESPGIYIDIIYIYLADSVFQSSLEAFSRMVSSEFQSTNPNLGLIPLSYWILLDPIGSSAMKFSSAAGRSRTPLKS